MNIPSHKRCAHTAIQQLAPCHRVRLPLDGLAALVAEGDQVAAGSCIARSAAGDPLERRVHSPLDGFVGAFDPVRHEVVIEGRPPPPLACGPCTPEAVPPEVIVTRAREAGLVGMGGGMFPTWAKLAVDVPVDTVLVNGRESEPYVTGDGRVLAEHRAEVACGLRLAMRALGAPNGRIARDDRGYPHGYEAFLVRDFTGRQVPPGGRPPDVGVVVLNVQTARSLHQAVCCGRPLIDRVLTVDGDAVGRPGNYVVPLGTEVGRVLAACDTDVDRIARVLGSGPMMAREVSLDDPVLPGTGAILALTRDEVPQLREGPCLRCGSCLEVCPLGLAAGPLVDDPDERALQCIECGLCAYVCMAHRPLVDLLRAVKADLRRPR